MSWLRTHDFFKWTHLLFIYFPFASSSSCADPFCDGAADCEDRAKLHRSEFLRSRAARERGRTFKVGLLPPHPLNGWSTLLGLQSGRKGRPFPQKPDCSRLHPGQCLLPDSATWFHFLFHFYINGKMEDLLGQPHIFAGDP